MNVKTTNLPKKTIKLKDMDYIIHISSTNNSFIGTGFMGARVSSMEDIKQAMCAISDTSYTIIVILAVIAFFAYLKYKENRQ